MATYLLFWNADISSYTKERFEDDFNRRDYVSNWSFYEHEQVQEDDTYYMVKCGGGRTGIVLRGVITSGSYEDHDWSGRGRRHIYYADIEPEITIDPWSDAPMLTPDVLTKAMPNVNWYGGHSGRRLDETTAAKLDELWYEYIDYNPALFFNGQAWYNSYNDDLMPEPIKQAFINKTEGRCEICGYRYADHFDAQVLEKLHLSVEPQLIPCPPRRRTYFNVCPSCLRVKKKYLYIKLKENGL